MKTIALNGASGFLGKQICEYFKNKYSIRVIKRDDYLVEPGKLADKIKGADIIINLAGARIKPVMSKSYEKEVYESRIKTTRNLKAAINLLAKKPELFISFSAVGIYAYDVDCDEASVNFGSDFLASVCKNWETAAVGTETFGNVLIIRVGIVLSNRGGFYKQMNRIFINRIGAIIGNGLQPISFIHISDFLGALDFCIEKHITGIANFVAPKPTNSMEFSEVLSRGLNRWLFLRIPSFVVRLALGRNSSFLLKGQTVTPRVLNDSGYKFIYPDINCTIANLIKTPSI